MPGPHSRGPQKMVHREPSCREHGPPYPGLFSPTAAWRLSAEAGYAFQRGGASSLILIMSRDRSSPLCGPWRCWEGPGNGGLFASSRMGSAYDLLQKRKILSQARSQATPQLCLLSLTFHAIFLPVKWKDTPGKDSMLCV